MISLKNVWWVLLYNIPWWVLHFASPWSPYFSRWPIFFVDSVGRGAQFLISLLTTCSNEPTSCSSDRWSKKVRFTCDNELVEEGPRLKGVDGNEKFWLWSKFLQVNHCLAYQQKWESLVLKNYEELGFVDSMENLRLGYLQIEGSFSPLPHWVIANYQKTFIRRSISWWGADTLFENVLNSLIFKICNYLGPTPPTVEPKATLEIITWPSQATNK